MSVEHCLRWRCDHEGCDRVVVLDGTALPNGWVWVYGDGRTTHRCAEHVAAIPKGFTVGRSGEARGRIVG